MPATATDAPMPRTDTTLPEEFALDALFPAGAVSVLSLRAPPGAPLFPAEAAAARSFAPARRAEFAHGRDCARRALRRLGVAPVAIPVGPGREPSWPPGIAGSISHAGVVAAAVVARREVIEAIGLDLEPDEPLDAELVARVCRPDEVARLGALDADPARAARRVFSMKEAAYKALWPLQRTFLEFHDLEVRVAAQAARFTVAVHDARCPPGLVERLGGRFMRAGPVFASAASVPARPGAG